MRASDVPGLVLWFRFVKTTLTRIPNSSLVSLLKETPMLSQSQLSVLFARLIKASAFAEN
ncbi:hypothetical protein BDW42DRAFT_173068 [Aspergillus taichungensis]|uniref:Uncharacterized protein n=1 Tax=Aspergillus taichungensis TaxID=482145 RepID=A0A2J5HPU1_9EURO|nr:hypothetical protein BDW42DRAFT_173068 [Aspergillus taichungensis]